MRISNLPGDKNAADPDAVYVVTFDGEEVRGPVFAADEELGEIVVSKMDDCGLPAFDPVTGDWLLEKRQGVVTIRRVYGGNEARGIMRGAR